MVDYAPGHCAERGEVLFTIRGLFFPMQILRCHCVPCPRAKARFPLPPLKKPTSAKQNWRGKHMCAGWSRQMIPHFWLKNCNEHPGVRPVDS
jgi:hypothetical protein